MRSNTLSRSFSSLVGLSLVMLEPIPDKELQQEAEIKSAIGEATLAWSHVEMQLCEILQNFMEPAVAVSTWDSIISFNARLNTVSNVVTLKIEDSEYLSLWGKLARKANRLSSLRNEVAHSTLLHGEKEGVLLVPYFSYLKIENQKKLTAKEILELSMSFLDLSHALMWFQYTLFPVEDQDIQRQATEPVPDLIIRFQKKDDQNPEEP